MRLLLFLLVSTLFAATPLRACSVPVFRYALEHWPPDPYQAVVFHRGPLTEAQQSLVRDLGADGLAGQLHANLSLRTVNLDDNSNPELLELSRQSVTGELPWLVVKFPRAARSTATVFSGPLTADAIRQLVDSPARQEIATRLSEGQTAVWVLLESGDAKKDTAAAQLIEARLGELASTLALPKLDPQDIVNGLVSVGQEDLRLAFSLLRVARTDAAEQTFIRALLGTERDLADAQDPILFPVFGRGRALYAFVGAGIKRETVDQAATFLIGKCSCQVKEQNPGADLLIAADWEGLIKASASAAPDLPTLAEMAKSAPVTVTISGGASPSATAGPFSWKPGRLYVAGGIAAALFVAGIFLFRKGF